MAKFTVTFQRQEDWFVQIKVTAKDAQEAMDKADDLRELRQMHLKWKPCDGNEYEPYIAAVHDENGEQL